MKYLLSVLMVFAVSSIAHSEDFVTGFGGKAISPVQNFEKQAPFQKQVQAPVQKAIQAPIQKNLAIQKSSDEICAKSNRRFTPFARLRKAREGRAEARAELALSGCG